MKAYLGVDVGSISSKAVVLDGGLNVLARCYLWTEGNPVRAVKQILGELARQLAGSGAEVVSVGTTGSARELVGAVLGANVVKNEITAHAVGTLSRYPEVRTIFEIGGQDSKIIIVRDGVPVDYAMNTLCAAGTGSFLSSQARRLGVAVEEFGDYAMRSTKPTKIAGRCTVFAESDMVHKAQMGHPTEDLVAGLCNAIVVNYLNNVGKGKEILPPAVFQGGVSKNAGVVRSFREITGLEVEVDDDGHLMGAIGVAIVALESGLETPFDFAVGEIDFTTSGFECGGCANDCEVVVVLRGGAFLDAWGNRCARGRERVRSRLDDEHGPHASSLPGDRAGAARG